jgi:hypothetical protein
MFVNERAGIMAHNPPTGGIECRTELTDHQENEARESRQLAGISRRIESSIAVLPGDGTWI